MKKLFLFLLFSLIAVACQTTFRVSSDTAFRNSIYYASMESVPTINVSHQSTDTKVIVVSDEEETYEEKLHKFDQPTYTITLTLDPWYYTYWRWNRWYVSPYYYDFTWNWSWRIYDYWGYYNPYRYSYYHYYDWSWYRPYYTHHRPYHPKHRPNHDIRYTRRGGVNFNHNPRPKTDHRTIYKRPTQSSKPRVAPNANHRPSTTNRTATQSRKPQARPTYNQTQRTGYSRGTTNRSSNTGRDYYRNSSPAQRTQPSARYNERNTSHQSSGVSRNSSNGGSTTRRK